MNHTAVRPYKVFYWITLDACEDKLERSVVHLSAKYLIFNEIVCFANWTNNDIIKVFVNVLGFVVLNGTWCAFWCYLNSKWSFSQQFLSSLIYLFVRKRLLSLHNLRFGLLHSNKSQQVFTCGLENCWTPEKPLPKRKLYWNGFVKLMYWIT